MSDLLTDVWDEHFLLMYQALAVVGMCDSPGGMESARVHDEAVAAGKPQGAALAEFIRTHANTWQ
jgi:hypothetical protein